MTSPAKRQPPFTSSPITTSAPAAPSYVSNAFGLGRSLTPIVPAERVCNSSNLTGSPSTVSLDQRGIALSAAAMATATESAGTASIATESTGVAPAPLTLEQQVAGLAAQVDWYQQQYHDQGHSLAKLQRFFGLRPFASYDDLLGVLENYNAVKMIFPDFYRAAGEAERSGRAVAQTMRIDTGQGPRRFKVTVESEDGRTSTTMRPPTEAYIAPWRAGLSGQRRVSTRTSSSSSEESSPSALESSQSSVASLRVPFSPTDPSPNSSLTQSQFARVPRLPPLPEVRSPAAKRPRR